MSTYRFKVSDHAEIDIPRICRENKDQDAFVVIVSDKIIYVSKKKLELRPSTDYFLQPESYMAKVSLTTDTHTTDTYDWDFGWDYITEEAPVEFRTTTFFKRVADARQKLSKKILVTVIAKD